MIELIIIGGVVALFVFLLYLRLFRPWLFVDGKAFNVLGKNKLGLNREQTKAYDEISEYVQDRVMKAINSREKVPWESTPYKSFIDPNYNPDSVLFIVENGEVREHDLP